MTAVLLVISGNGEGWLVHLKKQCLDLFYQTLGAGLKANIGIHFWSVKIT